MFNKEDSKKYVKGIINKKSMFKRFGSIMVTLTLITSLTSFKKNNSDLMKQHFEYEKKKIEYLQRVDEYKERKYDERVSNLYYNGSIKIDNFVYSLDDFFILYNNQINNNQLHLICVGNDYTDILNCSYDKYDYNGAIKFMNTEAFIELINSDAVLINNNLIEIVDKVKTQNILNKWNGFIHSLVKETDAIENKQVLLIEGDSNGRTK